MSGEIVQPVTTAEVHEALHNEDLPSVLQPGKRAIRDIVIDLETMGLVETWIDSRGNEGRVKQIETTFDPQWVRDAQRPYMEGTDQLDGITTEE